MSNICKTCLFMDIQSDLHAEPSETITTPLNSKLCAYPVT